MIHLRLNSLLIEFFQSFRCFIDSGYHSAEFKCLEIEDFVQKFLVVCQSKNIEADITQAHDWFRRNSRRALHHLAIKENF